MSENSDWTASQPLKRQGCMWAPHSFDVGIRDSETSLHCGTHRFPFPPIPFPSFHHLYLSLTSSAIDFSPLFLQRKEQQQQ